MILNSIAKNYVLAISKPDMGKAVELAKELFAVNEKDPAFLQFAIGVNMIRLYHKEVWKNIVAQVEGGFLE